MSTADAAVAIVENAAGMRLDEFARRHLFEPLGINAFSWRQGPGGRGVGHDAYGYMWYAKTYAVNGSDVRVHFASGNGGNKIYVVPRLGLVVVVTSSAYGQSYGQARSERILLRILANVRP